MKRLILPVYVLGLACLSPLLSRADAIYLVDGSLVITGDGTGCSPSSCTETIDFTFQILEGFVQSGLVGDYEITIIPGSGSATATGPLSAIVLPPSSVEDPGTSDPQGLGDDSLNYIPMLDAQGDEIDLHEAGNIWPISFVPSFPYGNTYGPKCQSAACLSDFGPFSVRGTINTTVTQVPEPSGVMTLLLDLVLLLVGMAIFRRGHSSRKLAE